MRTVALAVVKRMTLMIENKRASARVVRAKMDVRATLTKVSAPTTWKKSARGLWCWGRATPGAGRMVDRRKRSMGLSRSGNARRIMRSGRDSQNR
jgi:hypothetical protein